MIEKTLRAVSVLRHVIYSWRVAACAPLQPVDEVMAVYTERHDDKHTTGGDEPMMGRGHGWISDVDLSPKKQQWGSYVVKWSGASNGELT